jgi:DNA-binding XRE family transcriptional regulator
MTSFQKCLPSACITGTLKYRYDTNDRSDILTIATREKSRRLTTMTMKAKHGSAEPIQPDWDKDYPARLFLGFIIRRLREIRGMTQSDLALTAEANLSYISYIESNMNNISIRKIMMICNALQIQPTLLLSIQQCIAGSASSHDINAR